MSTAREGFNLFHKYGRQHFFRRGLFGDNWARQYVLKDTFGRYICKLFGHSKKTYYVADAKKSICLRCFEPITCPLCGNPDQDAPVHDSCAERKNSESVK